MLISESDAAKAVSLIEDGRSQRYVARALEIHRSLIQRAVKRFRETQKYTRKEGSGRKRATSPIDDRFVVLRTLRNRHSTAVHLQAESTNTIRRRLKEAGFRSRRPVKAPKLERQHRVAHLKFANDHTNWIMDQWMPVLFTDESRFCYMDPMGVKVCGRDLVNVSYHAP